MRYTLYSAAAFALRGNVLTMVALTLRAASKEEAEGLALRSIREQHPEAEGWRQHTARVGEVPMDWIREAATARQPRSEE